MNEKDKNDIRIIIIIVVSIISLICLVLWLYPIYMVWQQEMSGKAKLAEAEWSRKIAVQEAEAKKESAQHLADAEKIRAKGVAEANKIIGDSLKNNEAYLRYLFVNGLNEDKDDKTIIYIPTEANLPILESVRLITDDLKKIKETENQ